MVIVIWWRAANVVDRRLLLLRRCKARRGCRWDRRDGREGRRGRQCRKARMMFILHAHHVADACLVAVVVLIVTLIHWIPWKRHEKKKKSWNIFSIRTPWLNLVLHELRNTNILTFPYSRFYSHYPSCGERRTSLIRRDSVRSENFDTSCHERDCCYPWWLYFCDFLRKSSIVFEFPASQNSHHGSMHSPWTFPMQNIDFNYQLFFFPSYVYVYCTTLSTEFWFSFTCICNIQCLHGARESNIYNHTLNITISSFDDTVFFSRSYAIGCIEKLTVSASDAPRASGEGGKSSDGAESCKICKKLFTQLYREKSLKN